MLKTRTPLIQRRAAEVIAGFPKAIVVDLDGLARCTSARS
jgi:hypothetical protein